MSDELIKFVSARQWRKAVQEQQDVALLGKPVAPDGLGVRLGFVAEVETLTKAATPKPEGRQLLIAISSESVDRDTDTIAVDGWKLEQYRKNPVVLFGHRYFNNEAPVVGRSLAEFVDKGKLKSLMEFTHQGVVPLADTLYALYSEGFMSAASVGFIPEEWKFPKDDPKRQWGVDFLVQELIEYSLVPVPSNPDALVEARSKGIETEPLKSWTEEVLDAWGQNKERNLWIAKSALKALRDAADPKQARSAQVPGAIAKPEGPGDPPESGKTGVQTVLFDKEKWTEAKAKTWLEEHDFHSSAMDETENAYRFRQFDPEACAPDSYVTLTEGFPDGVSAVSCTGKAASAALEKGASDATPIEKPAEAKPESVADRVVEFSEGALRFKLSPGDAELVEAIAATDWTITQIGEVCVIQARSVAGTGAPEPAAGAAGAPESRVPDGDKVVLSDAQLELLGSLGVDCETMKIAGDGGDGGFVIVESDDDGSEERSLSDLRQVLAEVIGEGVEAAITHALQGGKTHAA